MQSTYFYLDLYGGLLSSRRSFQHSWESIQPIKFKVMWKKSYRGCVNKPYFFKLVANFNPWIRSVQYSEYESGSSLLINYGSATPPLSVSRVGSADPNEFGSTRVRQEAGTLQFRYYISRTVLQNGLRVGTPAWGCVFWPFVLSVQQLRYRPSNQV